MAAVDSADLLLIKTQIKYGSAATLAGELVLERVPAVFQEDWALYRKWRASLSARLEVDPCDVVVTGSAAAGFSLNPDKNLRLFGDHSDVDAAVISPFHFDTAWRLLREKKSSDVSPTDWDYIMEHKSYYVFEGCIALDRILHLMPFGSRWKSAFEFMKTQPPTEERNIKARLYRDNDSVRLYQKMGLEKLQVALNKGTV
jgi:hypothetical protein